MGIPIRLTVEGTQRPTRTNRNLIATHLAHLTTNNRQPRTDLTASQTLHTFTNAASIHTLLDASHAQLLRFNPNIRYLNSLVLTGLLTTTQALADYLAARNTGTHSRACLQRMVASVRAKLNSVVALIEFVARISDEFVAFTEALQRVVGGREVEVRDLGVLTVRVLVLKDGLDAVEEVRELYGGGLLDG